MLYTRQMAYAVRNIKKPYKNLKVSISDCSDHLEVLVFEDNIDTFSELEKMNIMEYLIMVENVLNSFPNITALIAGVPSRQNNN